MHDLLPSAAAAAPDRAAAPPHRDVTYTYTRTNLSLRSLYTHTYNEIHQTLSL